MTKNASFGFPLLLTKLYLSLTIDSWCRDYPLSIAIVWAQSKDMCRHDSLFVHRNAYRLYLTLQQEFCVPRLEQQRHRRALRSARRVHLFGQMYLDLNTSSPIFCLVFLKEKKQCTKLSSSSGQTQQTRKTHKLIFKKKKNTRTHIHLGTSKGFIDVTEHGESAAGEGRCWLSFPQRVLRCSWWAPRSRSQRTL